MPDSRRNIRLADGYRLQWEETQQADVLLFPEGMVQLSGSAAAVLKQCGGKSAEEIVQALQAEFPDADLRDDVLEFIDEALTKGWIRGD